MEANMETVPCKALRPIKDIMKDITAHPIAIGMTYWKKWQQKILTISR